MFYNNDSISKYDIYIIRSAFGESGSYGSRFRPRHLGHNTYKLPRRGKKDNVTPIQGPVLKNDKHFYYKRCSLNFIP